MDGLNAKLYKTAALVWAYMRLPFRRRKRISSGRILIIANGKLGDVLNEGQTIDAIVEHFTSAEKTVHFACYPQFWTGSQMLRDMSGVVYTELPNRISSGDKSGEIIKSVSRELQAFEYEQVILLLYRLNFTMLSLAAQLSVGRLIAVHYGYCNECSGIHEKLKFFFTKMIVDDNVVFSNIAPQKQSSRDFAKLICGQDFKVRINYLFKQCDYLYPYGSYITIAVDSFFPPRRWPTEKFIALIKYLLERFDHDVVLTGSNLPEEQIRSFEEAFRDCERVKNMVGKMSLQEWVELLRGAKFHIGVDSGSIHVAASVGTQAFCLAGQWDGTRFFPYEIEEQTENTANPICIYRSDVEPDQLACRYCAAKREYGWGDDECLVRCRAGEPCLCLERIEVEDVIGAIERARETGVIA